MVCHPTTHDTWRPTIPSPKARALPSSTTGTTDTGHPACSALPGTVCATTGTTATAHPACRALPGDFVLKKLNRDSGIRVKRDKFYPAASAPVVAYNPRAGTGGHPAAEQGVPGSRVARSRGAGTVVVAMPAMAELPAARADREFFAEHGYLVSLCWGSRVETSPVITVPMQGRSELN